MEPEGSLPHLQVPASCLYPELAQSSPNTDKKIRLGQPQEVKILNKYFYKEPRDMPP
jgi:hypothetical protein